VFDISERSLLASIGTDDPATRGELEASDDRQLVITLAIAGAMITAAGFFIAWLKRAYTNLRALGVRNLRWGPGWAIGSWFVPFLNLVLPKQLVNDVWRGSDPELEDSEGWREKPVPLLFAFWWGAWIVGGILESAADRAFGRAEGPNDFQFSSGVSIAGDALLIVAGLLAVVVVDMTTSRQAAAVAAAGGDEHPGTRARHWLSSVRVAAAVALCCVAAGLGVLTVAVQPAGSTTAAPDSEPAADVTMETLHTDDFSDPNSGWVSEENAEVSYSYEDGEYRISAISPEFWRLALFDFGATVARVSVAADATLRSPPADDDAVGIGCFVGKPSGYLGLVWPDGYYAIAIDPKDSEVLSPLREGPSTGVVNPVGSVNRIDLECEAGPPAIVTLTVNGRRLAQARHEDGLGRFHIAGLLVLAGADLATGHFDNLEVSGG
jgi:Domain of unknown function (DUF4328)